MRSMLYCEVDGNAKPCPPAATCSAIPTMLAGNRRQANLWTRGHRTVAVPTPGRCEPGPCRQVGRRTPGNPGCGRLGRSRMRAASASGCAICGVFRSAASCRKPPEAPSSGVRKCGRTRKSKWWAGWPRGNRQTRARVELGRITWWNGTTMTAVAVNPSVRRLGEKTSECLETLTQPARTPIRRPATWRPMAFAAASVLCRGFAGSRSFGAVASAPLR